MLLAILLADSRTRRRCNISWRRVSVLQCHEDDRWESVSQKQRDLTSEQIQAAADVLVDLGWEIVCINTAD